MKPGTSYKNLSRCAAIGFTGFALAAPVAPAAVIVNDTFQIGATEATSPGTLGNDAGDPTDIPWFKTSNSPTHDVLADTTLGSSHVMRYDPFGGSRALVGTMYNAGLPQSTASVGPDIGNQAKLSFRYRASNTNTDTFSFGLYNSSGTQTTANGNGSAGNDFGYGGRISVGTAGTGSASVYQEAGGNDAPTFGTDITLVTSTASTPVLVSSTSAKYLIELFLTRRAGDTLGLDLYVYSLNTTTNSTTLIGGATGAVDTTTPYTTFDEVVFGLNGSRARFDDIRVETIVPEPASAGLAVVALAAAALRRRRHA